MAKAGVAGGQIGGEDATLLAVGTEPVSPDAGATENQPQANDQPFTDETVQAMIDIAVADAVEGVKTEYEGSGGHLAKVRSQMQTQANEQATEFAAERAGFESDIHQLSVKDMDEGSRALYERDLYRDRATGLAGQLEDTRTALAASQQVGSYVRGLVQEFGVDIDDLNLDSVEDLSNTAFTAAATAHKRTLTELAEATERIQELEEGVAETTPSEAEKAALPEAPDVTTSSATGAAAPSATSLLDLRKKFSAGLADGQLITEETLFDLAEDPEVTGVDLNVVLESIQAELDALEPAE